MNVFRENLALAALMAFAVLVGPVGVLATVPVTESSQIVLVVGPRAAEAAAASGAKVVGPVQPAFAVLASATPMVADGLWRNGVWGVFDAGRLAALCGWKGMPDD